jgi:hypothetical protein
MRQLAGNSALDERFSELEEPPWLALDNHVDRRSRVDRLEGLAHLERRMPYPGTDSYRRDAGTVEARRSNASASSPQRVLGGGEQRVRLGHRLLVERRARGGRRFVPG